MRPKGGSDATLMEYDPLLTQRNGEGYGEICVARDYKDENRPDNIFLKVAPCHPLPQHLRPQESVEDG